MNQDNQSNEKNAFYIDALQYNMKQLELFSIVIYLVAGTMAGILGLTGLNGLILFLAVSATSYLALLLKMKMSTLSYTTSSIFGLVFGAASSQALTFILFWTFAFALVHLY